MYISYNWLQNYFEEKLPDPKEISEGIIFHSFEVEDIIEKNNDTIFDIKILPDRAHDCLSHFGIAKEISAIFDLKLKDDSWGKGRFLKEPSQEPSLSEKETGLKIEIQSEDCPRYMGRIIRNVKVGPSPAWLSEKLESIGQKSINNIVDMANFVMFDLGQPIHAFDLDKLTSSKEEVVSIKVRNAKKGEKITTLDKKEVELDENILIIADDKDPLAIAGIKGGTKAEVDNGTKNIVIEVANFNHTTTRKTAKKINIQTDAVKRYENQISPELCSLTMDVISDMIFSSSGGEVEDIVDVYKEKQKDRFISISLEYINKRLGSNFTKEEIKTVWDKLKFIYKMDGNNFEIEVPPLRFDLVGPHDLTEEVIRILGYDRLEEKLPEIKKEEKINEVYYNMLLSRYQLLNDGYSEVMTYVFCNSGQVEVLASASDKTFLRNNLSDGLKESIKLNTFNLPLLGVKEVKVFEIGTVFYNHKLVSGENEIKEEMHVAFGDRKGVTEMMLKEFVEQKIPSDKKLFSVTRLNELEKEKTLSDKKLSAEKHGYFSAEKFLVLAPSRSQGISEETFSPQVFKPWSNYPFIVRDIAVWVEGDNSENCVTSKEKIVRIYKELGGEILFGEPILFDEFKKENKTSIAYRLIFQSYERTLTDEEVNKIMTKINKKITELGFVIR